MILIGLLFVAPFIPNELLEAAKIDGLTKAGAFFKIMIPLLKPVFATIVIVAFTGTWNS